MREFGYSAGYFLRDAWSVSLWLVCYKKYLPYVTHINLHTIFSMSCGVPAFVILDYNLYDVIVPYLFLFNPIYNFGTTLVQTQYIFLYQHYSIIKCWWRIHMTWLMSSGSITISLIFPQILLPAIWLSFKKPFLHFVSC